MLLRWLDAISLRAVLLTAAGWLLFFALIYAVVPCYLGELARLKDSPVCELNSLPHAFYISVATMFSLGYSDIYPTGLLRAVAAVEVIGGVVFTGLAIASIVATPANHTRLAIKACRGHWLECIDFNNGKRFYSFSSMFSDGKSLIKRGRNVDPGGEMHGTTYYGTLVTHLFPTLMSIYKNDNLSTYYSEGILSFQMEMNSTGTYRSYSGGSLDREHGGRDRVYGKKIEDPVFIKKFDEGTVTDADLNQLIQRFFGKFPITDTPASITMPGTVTTVIKDGA